MQTWSTPILDEIAMDARQARRLIRRAGKIILWAHSDRYTPAGKAFMFRIPKSAALKGFEHLDQKIPDVVYREEFDELWIN